jgi:integrase
LTKSGRNYLDSIAHVYAFANEDGVAVVSPVTAFRANFLRRKAKTQRWRAESEKGRHVRPIENPAHIDLLLGAAISEGLPVLVAVLLGLDAGPRKGEAFGLRWADFRWGESENDLGRALWIARSASGGGPIGPTKSGREREVALSRRLRAGLEALHAKRTRKRDGYPPEQQTLVLEGIDYGWLQDHCWPRLIEAAGLTGITFKDLRDTFASHLLTAGVQLGYISKQLGHADVSVTAQHYARWAGGSEYRDPMRREPGEVPADFLARLPGAERGDSPEGFQHLFQHFGAKSAQTLVGRTGLEPVTSAV